MKYEIFCDPVRDREVRRLFRSCSPKKMKAYNAKHFKELVYPRFESFLKRKHENVKKRKERKQEIVNHNLEQLNFSKLYPKKVECPLAGGFMTRNKHFRTRMANKEEANNKTKTRLQEETVSSCTFRPKTRRYKGFPKQRSLRDLYAWEKRRDRKRVERKVRRDKDEMAKCVSRFRSPLKRTQITKSVHLSNR